MTTEQNANGDLSKIPSPLRRRPQGPEGGGVPLPVIPALPTSEPSFQRARQCLEQAGTHGLETIPASQITTT